MQCTLTTDVIKNLIMIVIDFIRGDKVQSAGHNCKINPLSIPQTFLLHSRILVISGGLICDNDRVTAHYFAYYMAVDY